MADEKKMLPARISVYCSTDLTQKAYVKYYDEQGKRVRVYGQINRQKTYEARYAAALATMAQIVANYRPVVSIETRAREYLATHQHQWRKKTHSSYCSKLRLFLAWAKGRELTPALARDYIQHLGETVGKGTRNDSLRMLRMIFKAIGEGSLFAGIPNLRHHAEPAKYFQRHHITMLREQIAPVDADLWFVCQCVYNLFLRPHSELRLLQAEHFDLDRMKVRVPAKVGKNGKPQHITIPPPFREDVIKYLRGKGPSDYVFPSPVKEGRPVSENYFSEKFRKHLDALRFGPDYGLYSWKHTGAMHLANLGVPAKQIQIQCRHHSLEITDRYLQQLGVNDLNQLEDLFPKL